MFDRTLSCSYCGTFLVFRIYHMCTRDVIVSPDDPYYIIHAATGLYLIAKFPGGIPPPNAMMRYIDHVKNEPHLLTELIYVIRFCS
jgi:hypothetical protein